MDQPEWSLAETKERVRLSLREAFPLHFGERWEEARDIYLDAVPRDPSGTADAAARARGDAARPGGAGDLSRGGQQQDRRPAAARSRAARLGGLVRQRRRSRRRAARQAGVRSGPPGAGSRAACRPGTRYGLSAIPRSTWNAPATAAASRFCSAIWSPPRSFPGNSRVLRPGCASRTRQACFTRWRACGSRRRAHLRRRKDASL